MPSEPFSKQADELINQLSSGLSVARGEDFFPTMTKSLALLLHADYALIGELVSTEQEQIRSLAFVVDGALAENFSYTRKDTPSEQVINGKASVYAGGIQKKFPKDPLLVELGAEGYLGIPLTSFDDEPLGIVSVLFRQPISNPTQVEKLLRIFAGRASSELERRRYHAVLDRRKRELKLQSQQNFRRFYENSPLSFQTLNSEGRLVDVNPAWVDTFGYRREEILGRKFSALMTDESAALFAQRFPLFKKHGEARDAAFEIISKSGHTLQILLQGGASYDERGKFQHSNCILADVTQSRRAEARIRKNEEKNRLMSRQFQALLDCIPDRILLLDPELRIVWTNQKEGFQQTPFPKNPKGTFCYEAMYGNTIACPKCPGAQCFESGEVVQYERVHPDGRIWLQRAFPIRDDQGKVFNVVEIDQDITEKVQLQNETARTGQLALLGELAAGVAHEINNPITGVINYAQLLKNHSDQETKEHDLANRIIKEGDRISQIVKQLLFLSKDDQGDLKKVDITEVLSESLALIGSQLNSDGIDISITLSENLPKISGRQQQLEQLFINILSNARYALNRRYPQNDTDKRVEVKLNCEKTDSKLCLVVRIHDRGIGIPADLLNKVLQPFVTSKSSSEGTGLGLSISNDIVNSHGGSLNIESEEGVYTQVVIRFPVQGA